MKSVENYYNSLFISENRLEFERVSPESVLKALQNLDTKKASGIDNISGRFLKDGAQALATPISQICNLSISTSSFPDGCKIAAVKLPNLNHYLKKGLKLILRIFVLSLFCL